MPHDFPDDPCPKCSPEEYQKNMQKYSIKIYRHKSIVATIDDDFIKCREYFKKHEIDLVLEIEETQIKMVDVPALLMQPAEGKYDAVAYLYDRSAYQTVWYGLAFPISKNLCGIYLATDKINDSVDYTWKSLSHEIMHTFFHRLISNRYLVVDPMDAMLVGGVWKPFYNNEQPDNPDSNFGEAWRRLKPLWNKLFLPMRVLKKGMRGEDVKELQQKLQIIADGIFGAYTEKKVKEFQNKNGLVADGIVGRLTWVKLK